MLTSCVEAISSFIALMAISQTLTEVAGLTGLNADCSGSSVERDWLPCICERHIRKS
jgi:hypothetical protein